MLECQGQGRSPAARSLPGPRLVASLPSGEGGLPAVGPGVGAGVGPAMGRPVGVVVHPTVGSASLHTDWAPECQGLRRLPPGSIVINPPVGSASLRTQTVSAKRLPYAKLSLVSITSTSDRIVPRF